MFSDNHNNDFCFFKGASQKMLKSTRKSRTEKHYLTTRSYTPNPGRWTALTRAAFLRSKKQRLVRRIYKRDGLKEQHDKQTIAIFASQVFEETAGMQLILPTDWAGGSKNVRTAWLQAFFIFRAAECLISLSWSRMCRRHGITEPGPGSLRSF